MTVAPLWARRVWAARRAGNKSVPPVDFSRTSLSMSMWLTCRACWTSTTTYAAVSNASTPTRSSGANCLTSSTAARLVAAIRGPIIEAERSMSMMMQTRRFASCTPFGSNRAGSN